MLKIDICNDFSKALGPRKKSQGDYSGEEFYEKFLHPKYDEAIKNNDKLEINLDGCYSYPPSFVDESFGELARCYGLEQVIDRIVFISNDDATRIEEIKNYMKKGVCNCA